MGLLDAISVTGDDDDVMSVVSGGIAAEPDPKRHCSTAAAADADGSDRKTTYESKKGCGVLGVLLVQAAIIFGDTYQKIA